jgi:phosphatidylglycerophosphate synthase
MTTAWRLPDEPLRTSVLGIHAAGLVTVIAASVMLQRLMALRTVYLLVASGTFTVIALLTAGLVRRSHPFTRFGPANGVTTLRIGIVSLVSALIGEPSTAAVATTATVASVIVTLLDGVDGWLARRSGMASAFGARFDMETDALLIMALSVLTWRSGKAGAWVLLAGLMRYLFVLVGWIDHSFERPLLPSRRRQAVCVVQIVGLSLVVLPAVTPPQSTWLAAALVLVLACSFAVDTIWLWQHRDA